VLYSFMLIVSIKRSLVPVTSSSSLAEGIMNDRPLHTESLNRYRSYGVSDPARSVLGVSGANNGGRRPAVQLCFVGDFGRSSTEQQHGQWLSKVQIIESGLA
jgi:hypothetical protein